MTPVNTTEYLIQTTSTLRSPMRFSTPIPTSHCRASSSSMLSSTCSPSLRRRPRVSRERGAILGLLIINMCGVPKGRYVVCRTAWTNLSVPCLEGHMDARQLESMLHSSHKTVPLQPKHSSWVVVHVCGLHLRIVGFFEFNLASARRQSLGKSQTARSTILVSVEKDADVPRHCSSIAA